MFAVEPQVPKLDTRYLIKRGKIWWVTKRVAGKKRSESLRTKDHSEAVERRDAWLRELKKHEDKVDKARIFKKLRAEYLRASDEGKDIIEDIVADEANDIAYDLGVYEAYNSPSPKEILTAKEKKPKQHYEKSLGRLHVFADWVDEFAEAASSRDENMARRRAMQVLMKDFTCLEEMTWEKAAIFLEEVGKREGVSKATVSRWKGNYSNFWRYLKKNSKAIWSGHTIPKTEPTKERTVYNYQQIGLIVKTLREANNTVSNWLLNVVMIALHTGARRGAIALMEYNHADKTILFPKLKTEKWDRIIPAHEAIINNCIDWQADRRSKSSITEEFKKLRDKLGFDRKHYDFHTLRHTFSTEMKRLQVDEIITADIMGHRIKTMTYGVYGHGTEVDAMKEAIDKIHYPIEKYL